ncbi:MAG TPA: VOC family protein [Bryobacteraceae bacterium]|nr:VOC family protein [Bryobacteraceae bacterium]
MSTLQEFPRITPFLWFDSNAEEAVDFYLTVFKNSRRLSEFRNVEGCPGPKGSIRTNFLRTRRPEVYCIAELERAAKE